MSAIATGQESDYFVESGISNGGIRELDDLCSRQLSTYLVLGPHMPATNVSSRGDARATERPQYCPQREYSVARA